MKVVKLTKKAQDIVNQIMSADAIDLEHGPVVQRVTYGNISLQYDKLVLSVDGNSGEMHIENEILNNAVIKNSIIEIAAEDIKDNEYGDMSITLYKLTYFAAL